MRTILLISANTEIDPYPVYPVALAKLSAAVEAAGHRAVQFDLLAHGRVALDGAIDEAGADLIGVSIRNIDNVNASLPRSYVNQYRELVGAIRGRTRAPVVVGGAGASLLPRELLNLLEVEAVVVGPGEAALVALLEAGPEPQRWGGIPGVLTKWSAGEARPPEDAPPPGKSRHDGRLVEYYWRAAGMIGLQTNRGCPQACSYCTYQAIEGPARQWADPAAVVDEMAELQSRHGVSYFFLTNSTFNTPSRREAAVAEEICRRSLKISWGGYFAPCRMDREYLGLLQRSGLKHLEFGTDALSETMLKSYNKGFTVDEAVAVAEMCAELGLHQLHFLLLGGPGETRSTIAETLANTRRIRRAVFCPFVGIRVFPGTGIYENYRAEGRCTGASMLKPEFYLAPGLDQAEAWRMLEEAGGGARNWIVTARQQEMAPFMAAMRRRGVVGPMWEYLAH